MYVLRLRVRGLESHIRTYGGGGHNLGGTSPVDACHAGYVGSRVDVWSQVGRLDSGETGQ